jgi:type III pantothenate kinase
MTPHVVVDVGNSRIKWGRCAQHAIQETASLPHGDLIAWQQQMEHWQMPAPVIWVVSGVNPPALEQLKDWALRRGDTVLVLDKAQLLPLETRLEYPNKAGIDRLLNAVAANARRRQGVPAAIIDAGSAVTVDYIDEAGAYCGGTIFPGVRLMMHALNEYTALLPLVEVSQPVPKVPCSSTIEAMQAGVFWAVAGGIQTVVNQLAQQAKQTPEIFLTGGDALLLQPTLQPAVWLWPTMTLEGVRLAAERLP